MNSIAKALKASIKSLDAEMVSFALVGGLAVSARTEPRFTRDIDLAVAIKDDARAEKLVFDLQKYSFRLITVIEQEKRNRLATARMEFDDGNTKLIVDLLFASSGIEDLVVNDAEVIEILPKVELPVARSGHLLALKLLARDDKNRPQDVVDINALCAKLNEVEIRRAKEAVNQIELRGYARNRDLKKMLLDTFSDQGL